MSGSRRLENTLDCVVGGQYGSESKGRVTGACVQRRERGGRLVVCVRTAGPNAGHVVYDAQGRRYALRCVPVGAVVSDECMLFVGPGSEVDLGVLEAEVIVLEADGHLVRNRLWVSQHATWLEPAHRHMESGYVGDGSDRLKDDLIARTGSTGKGVGAARAERIWRRAHTIGEVASVKPGTLSFGAGAEAYSQWKRIGVRLGEVSEVVNALHHTGRDGVATVIEGTQGYGLGLHTDAYPQVTSSDCRIVDFLAMAGLDPYAWKPENVNTHVVIRPNPIRVAGNSGPLLGETSWEALGLPVERTTVTQKVRRVGKWDGELVAAACVANGSRGRSNVWLAVAMLDHVVPEVAGVVTREDLLGISSEARKRAQDYLDFVVAEARQLGGYVDVGYVGTGPQSTAWVTDWGWSADDDEEVGRELMGQ